MTELNHFNSGSAIYSRLKGRQQVVSHCHEDCFRIRTTPPIITHGRQHIPLLSWIFPCLPMFQGKLERGRPDLHWGWCNAPASGSGMVSMMGEFSSSAWFSEISNLFFSSSSFDHLILVYFSAIQWISSHLENAIWTENLYTTVHFPASKFVNLKALLSRWYQLHFYSDLVFVPES